MTRRTRPNPAHHDAPLWKLCLLGFALGVASMGVGEALLRAAS